VSILLRRRNARGIRDATSAMLDAARLPWCGREEYPGHRVCVACTLVLRREPAHPAGVIASPDSGVPRRKSASNFSAGELTALA